MGDHKLSRELTPSAPNSPSPQVKSSPASVTAAEWAKPAEMNLVRWKVSASTM